MDTTDTASNETREGTTSSGTAPPDPLRRVFVPIERRMTNGHFVFETSDRSRYVRMADTGVIRRAQPKVNGKLAKKARQKCRP